jgi:chromosome segregation ATPase
VFICPVVVTLTILLTLIILRNANSLLEQEFTGRICYLEKALQAAKMPTGTNEKCRMEISDLQNERDGLLVVVQELKRKMNRMEDEYRLLQESTSAPQPVSYLYSKLQEEERSKIGFSQSVRKLECQITDLQDSLKLKDTECEELKERLELILRNRSELHSVREMIEHLHMLENEIVEEDREDSDKHDDAVNETACLPSPSGDLNLFEPAHEESCFKKFGLSKELLQRMTTRPGSQTRLPFIRTKSHDLLPGIIPLSHTREILT